METFYKQQIKDAYSRCFGLEMMVKEADEQADKSKFDAVVYSLAYQTGLRTEFIKDNLNDIKEI